MSDLISRQEAMEVIEKMMEVYWDRKLILAKVWRQIKDLPSAPERMCHGCVYEKHGSVVCDNCSRFFLDRYEVDNNE